MTDGTGESDGSVESDLTTEVPVEIEGADAKIDPDAENPVELFYKEPMPGERGKARVQWGYSILALFLISTLGTLSLVCWAFYIDQKIIFQDIDLSTKPERIITTEVVLRLISATVFQVGAATAGIIGWAFFGSRGFEIFKGQHNGE